MHWGKKCNFAQQALKCASKALKQNIKRTKQHFIVWLMNIQSSYMDPSLKHHSIFYVFST